MSLKRARCLLALTAFRFRLLRIEMFTLRIWYPRLPSYKRGLGIYEVSVPLVELRILDAACVCWVRVRLSALAISAAKLK
jgi:hypothetical protein